MLGEFIFFSANRWPPTSSETGKDYLYSELANTNPVSVTESLIKDLYQSQSLWNVRERKLDNIKPIITSCSARPECNHILRRRKTRFTSGAENNFLNESY